MVIRGRRGDGHSSPIHATRGHRAESSSGELREHRIMSAAEDGLGDVQTGVDAARVPERETGRPGRCRGRSGLEPGMLRLAPAASGTLRIGERVPAPARNLLDSQRERVLGTLRFFESVLVGHQRAVRKPLPMRSHFSLVANRRRGSVNRSPQGAIRGGFAVSPQNSEPFARCACRDGALAGARRERRASAMSAAWDSSPALSPVPWGERNGEAFNCVPGG